MALPNWLHLSVVSGSGDTIVTVSADTSDSANLRSYDLVVSGITKSALVPVLQSDVVVADDTVTIDPSGGTISVGYTAATTPTVTVDNTAFTATVSGDTIVIEGGVSPSTGQTTGTVTVSAGTSVTAITVTQDGVHFYVTGSDTHNIQPAATSDTFTITGNVPWKPAVSSGANWLLVSDTNTRQPNTASSVYYQAPVNWTVTERHGVIAVTWGETFQYSQDIAYVNQEGLPVGSTDYLTLEITSGGVIKWNSQYNNNNRVILYRKSSADSWTDITASTQTSIPVSVGDKVELKGVNTAYGRRGFFSGSTASFNVFGNIMSLVYGDNFIGNFVLPAYDETWGPIFDMLFMGCNVQSAEHLILPATALTYGCYGAMFKNTTITTPPALPATVLADECYANMFEFCQSLAYTPELPAIEATVNCYNLMFRGCSNITQAPVLPATSLATGCYVGMFMECTGIQRAPDLLVSTMVADCYGNMFNGCTSLNYVKCLATNPSVGATYDWVRDTASSGTFVKAAGVTKFDWNSWRTAGLYEIPDDGIPNNWTVVDA